jgi:putative ABC transport system permease protein
MTDLRQALRQLRNAPGITTTAVITLALGIGATTAIFTLVHQVMLKSLPVTNPDELWAIGDKIRCCNWVDIPGRGCKFFAVLVGSVQELSSANARI